MIDQCIEKQASVGEKVNKTTNGKATVDLWSTENPLLSPDQ
jgi:hypothetical protein